MSTGKVDTLRKGVIIGDSRFPMGWFCKCGHLNSEHEHSGLSNSVACVKEGTAWHSWADKCMNFDPVDNLTFVEKEAHERLSI